MGFFKKIFSDAADELKKNLEDAKKEMLSNLEEVKQDVMVSLIVYPIQEIMTKKTMRSPKSCLVTFMMVS